MTIACARYLHTPWDAVLEWDVDDLIANQAELNRLLEAESASD